MIASDKKIQFAVVGGGVIGGGWVARFLLMGFDVKVFDPDPETERKINQVIEMLGAHCQAYSNTYCLMKVL